MFSDEKLRILFVGEEKADGLNLYARAMEDRWEIDFRDDPGRAIESMQANPYDVVVADLAMRTGADAVLLEVVKTEFPQSVRIALADDASVNSFVDLVGFAHQQLVKPFDLDALKFVIQRATVLHRMVQDPALRYVLADVKSLPSLPALYLQIVDELQSDDPSIGKVGEIVASDIGMTAKVLQIANSVVVGARVKISDPVQATVRLGSEMVKSLVLVSKVFDQFDESATEGVNLNDVLDHSMRVATYAQKIARTAGLERDDVDAAFTAGLLHDVGKMILAANLPDSYRMACDIVKQRGIPGWLAEKEIFGATHAEVGAYLTGLWGLPDSVFTAMLDHHTPRQTEQEGFCSLWALHCANAFDHGYVPGEAREDEDTPLLDAQCLDIMGFGEDRLASWHQACFPEI